MAFQLVFSLISFSSAFNSSSRCSARQRSSRSSASKRAMGCQSFVFLPFFRPKTSISRHFPATFSLRSISKGFKRSVRRPSIEAAPSLPAAAASPLQRSVGSPPVLARLRAVRFPAASPGSFPCCLPSGDKHLPAQAPLEQLFRVLRPIRSTQRKVHTRASWALRAISSSLELRSAEMAAGLRAPGILSDLSTQRLLLLI